MAGQVKTCMTDPMGPKSKTGPKAKFCAPVNLWSQLNVMLRVWVCFCSQCLPQDITGDKWSYSPSLERHQQRERAERDQERGRERILKWYRERLWQTESRAGLWCPAAELSTTLMKQSLHWACDTTDTYLIALWMICVLWAQSALTE